MLYEYNLPPDEEHVFARNMLRIDYIKELCIKLVTYQKLYRDAWSAIYKML